MPTLWPLSKVGFTISRELIFEDNSYRTTPFKKVIDRICRPGKCLGGSENEESPENSELSNVVPRTRLFTMIFYSWSYSKALARFACRLYYLSACETSFHRRQIIKPRLTSGPLCPGQDSNLHAVSSTTTSKWLVYQFQHLGT